MFTLSFNLFSKNTAVYSPLIYVLCEFSYTAKILALQRMLQMLFRIYLFKVENKILQLKSYTYMVYFECQNASSEGLKLQDSDALYLI